ncbi:uncharacterized protein [Triticum aestivum]|uniref:uncharacterized protein n=1 Tax=Triticum aestivum TaxID=4565 RepID=UPI001D003F2B|nr:uncharacterized protein LOC123040405 [Triticum aestivum]
MDNQPGRAVVLGTEFRNLVQGELSIAEYSRGLKTLADALEHVGEHISDQALTLQLIRGLNRKFQIMAMLLPMQSRFPSFVQARSRLLMEEISAHERARLDGHPELPAAALTIGQAPLGSSSSNRDPDRDGSSNDKDNGHAASPTRTTEAHAGVVAAAVVAAVASRPVAAPPAVPPLPPAQPRRSPRTTLLPMAPSSLACLHPRTPWAAPNATGVLGPRPPAPHQAYQVAAPSLSGPTWEQYNQLYAALQGLSIQQQQAGGAPEWFIDAGATSHVAGSSHGEANHEVQ